MPFIDTNDLEVIEGLPGWYGRYFHSPGMTFAHYHFKRGSRIHEHLHPQEEVARRNALHAVRSQLSGLALLLFLYLVIFKKAA